MKLRIPMRCLASMGIGNLSVMATANESLLAGLPIAVFTFAAIVASATIQLDLPHRRLLSVPCKYRCALTHDKAQLEGRELIAYQ